MRSLPVAGCIACLAVSTGAAQARPPLPADLQIRLAVQAAPAAARDGATVQGWNAAGAFVTLRQGGNNIICVAPNPSAQQLEVACHHRDLEAFLARGRALAAEGVTGERRTRARWDEITSGALTLPSGTVHSIVTGTGFDSTTGQIQNPYIRWVIYVPNATGASTGLSETPTTPGAPWLMFAGTPGAHIMISPPRAATAPAAPRP